MKIVIDIPDKQYELIKKSDYNAFSMMVSKECMMYAIKNGTPMHDNATNGEVLISLYPNLKYTIQNGRVITTIGVTSSFDLDWWNDKYETESEK